MTNRDRLVQSAQELLWERGYVGMSPRAIQDRAEAGQGSMYHHFSGKADLAAAAIDGMAIAFKEGADRWLAKPGTPLERIRGYLLRSREALKGCQMGGLAHDPEIVNEQRLRAPLEETFAWLHRRLKALIEEGQQSGEIAAHLKADEVAATLIAVIQGAYVLARSANAPDPFRKAMKGAVALLECHST